MGKVESGAAWFRTLPLPPRQGLSSLHKQATTHNRIPLAPISVRLPPVPSQGKARSPLAAALTVF